MSNAILRHHREWFANWFDSPYYHLLYEHRDEAEASGFIRRLVQQLQLRLSDKVLDLACGKGRHAIFLNRLGYEVRGVDLSKSNIAMASWHANERLKFRVHDMRNVVKPDYFDVVLNLFTSFGYYPLDEDNARVVVAAAQNLKPGGQLVLDFMNTPRVLRQLVNEETQVRHGITFQINRTVVEGMIVKDIRFDDNGQHYAFQEKVKVLEQADFERYFAKAGLRVEAVYGDYHFAPYAPQTSERMIFVGRRA